MRKKKSHKENCVEWATVPEKCSPEEAETLAQHEGEYVRIGKRDGRIRMRADPSGSSVQLEFGVHYAPLEVESIIKAKFSKMKPLWAAKV
jgi:formylmethanofuran dehydrogenase subunit D